MGASSNKAAFGTLFKKGGTSVSEVTNISGPNISRDAIDVTHHESPGGWEEYIPNTTDPGEVTIDINFKPNDSTQQEILTDISSRTVGSYSITWIDGSKVWPFSAFPTKFDPKAPVKGNLAASVTFKLTGPVTPA